jgi:hypothetical protein
VVPAPAPPLLAATTPTIDGDDGLRNLARSHRNLMLQAPDQWTLRLWRLLSCFVSTTDATVFRRNYRSSDLRVVVVSQGSSRGFFKTNNHLHLGSLLPLVCFFVLGT